MGELNSILKRSKFENLMAYLISEVGDNAEILDSFDDIISQSYETFFNELESLYKEANRNDDNLFDIVSTFTYIHDDVYFEAGMIVGFQLYKGFDTQYQNHKDTDIPALLRKQLFTKQGKRKSMELDTMLEAIQGHRIETALEETIRNNEAYLKLEETISQKVSQIDEIGLTHKQWQVVDSILSSSNAQSASYGEMAYKQGFKDAIKLYSELYE